MSVRASVRLLTCLLATMAVTDIAARDIHYGAAASEALLQCDRMHWQGAIEEGRACYGALLRAGDEARVMAEAAWALQDLQQANNWFRQAVQAAPGDAQLRVRWGDLFAATHQEAEAMDLYREALEIDPQNSFAHLGAARVLVGSFDDAANSYLQTLLDDPQAAPGARLAAWLLVGRVALENGNREDADNAMTEAQTILDAHDWPPLELYALRAAADLLDGITESEWTARALEYNPHYGGIYAIPAYFYVITRRYREAIDQYALAVDTDPQLAAAHEELGVNLLRDNQVGRARAHLETAHDLDPFSPKAVNTLRLLDSFANFRLVDDLPGGGHDVPITLRLHKDEADVIAPYAIAMTRDSIAQFTERYGFALREPVIIEMYPDHEDFAVRTAGMPGIGILGATFGYVVAMDSPSARPAEQFQWGTTLWHEIAHVFTLEATNHLVPRWFSEGVSVFEEWHSGPNQGVRIPMSVYAAMRDDRFLPIAGLDEGFIRPTYDEQVIVSYMQAGLICHFIATEHGIEDLRAMLEAFADGMTTAAAIEQVFGMASHRFDDAFADYVQREHGTILANFDDWHRTQTAIAGHVSENEWQAVPELARHLIDIMPGYVEPDSPYIALARALDELEDRPAAIGALETYWEQGGFEPQALRQLAAWLKEAGRNVDAIAVMQSLNYVDPLDMELHGELGDMLLAAGRAEEALQEFSVALALDPHDKANAYYRMAQAYYELGNRESSQDNLLQALDVAPNFRPAQRLLLELSRTEPGDDR